MKCEISPGRGGVNPPIVEEKLKAITSKVILYLCNIPSWWRRLCPIRFFTSGQLSSNMQKHTQTHWPICRHTYPNHQYPPTHRFTPSYALALWPLGVLTQLRCCCPSMTLLMKLTMATAGCSVSISANRWHTFSDVLPVRLATKPNTLQEWGMKRERDERRWKRIGCVFLIYDGRKQFFQCALLMRSTDITRISGASHYLYSLSFSSGSFNVGIYLIRVIFL